MLKFLSKNSGGKIVWISILRRFRVLTNQRVNHYSRSAPFDKEMVSDLFKTSEKQQKISERILKMTAIYLVVIYLSYSGSEFEISLFNAKLSDIPSLLEIGIFLFSLSLFYCGAVLLNSEMLRETIDSVIGSAAPSDVLSRNIIKYRFSPGFDFLWLFNNSFLGTPESIRPTFVTKAVNLIVKILSVVVIVTLYFVPILFVLFFALPDLELTFINSVLKLLAWGCAIFFTICFLAVSIPVPYREFLTKSPDTLFILPPSFLDNNRREYCPESAEAWGFLAYFPHVKDALNIHYVEIEKPRAAMTGLLGDKNQNAPTLVLHADSPSFDDVGIMQKSGHRFINNARDIGAYFSKRYGTPWPRGH